LTSYTFIPSASSAPQFTPTLDGNQYNVSIIWSLYGQRYTVLCKDLNGNVIFNVPLIESPSGQAIQSLVYDELHLQAVGQTGSPHGLSIGSTTSLTISGASPSIYNGTFLVLATGPDTFSYPLPAASAPNDATMPGTIGYQISLTAGYFASTMVFVNNTFVVMP
jgi:hypothetical protein